MRALHAFIAILAASAAFAQAGALLEEAQARETLLGSIAADWQLYTVLLLLVMVGLVALAYAIANAFSLPDLRAWADVELGEIFASALLMIFIIGIVFFIDAAVEGMAGPSFPGSCERPGFCPANIASDYLNSYKDSAFSLYRDITVSNINKAKEATAGNTVGVRDLMYLYLTFRFRVQPEEMVIVEMYDQLLQNLGTVINALIVQEFMLKFLTFRLAPLAIFLGIIMRSFFLTRKLGGLLLAFGLGFLIVYPLTYALAWFTLDSAVYGAQKGETGQLSTCPEVCLPGSRIVDYAKTPIEEVSAEDVRQAFYEDCLSRLSDVDETGRSRECMDGCVSGYAASCEEGCGRECRLGGLSPPVEDCTAYCEGRGIPAPVEDCKAFCSESTGLTYPEMYDVEGFEACVEGCDATAPAGEEWNACIAGCSARYGGPAPELVSCEHFCRDNLVEPSTQWLGCLRDCGDSNAAARPLWEECTGECEERENCDATEAEKVRHCRSMCPVLPEYEEGKEEYCRQDAEKRFLEMGTGWVDISSGGSVIHRFGYCEYDPCGFPIPYHTGCHIPLSPKTGDYVAPDVCNARYFNYSDPAYWQFDYESEINGCPEECRALVPLKPIASYGVGFDRSAAPVSGQNDYACFNWECKERYETEEEYCKEKLGCTDENMHLCCIHYNWPADWACKKYGLDCPSQCMWITTSGKTDDDCPEDCNKYRPDYESDRHAPQDPLYLWENNLSRQTCMYIIPDIVFENPEHCSACAFVAEKGLAMKPQMILDCSQLCGAPGNAVMAEDPATMTNNIKGMIGPSEVISVSKLMVPAYVLPVFCLAVTLMFIMALSPMLGGDIDIPGMMRMMA